MANVIKASDAESMPELENFSFGNIEQMAAQLLAEARQQRNEILERARQQAEAIRREAREKGYADGLEQGRTEGSEQGRAQAHQEAGQALARQTEQAVAAVEALLRELENRQKELHKQAVDGCLSLACAIAERLVHREVLADPKVVEGTLAEALSLATCNGAVTVTVHPQDRETVQQFLPELVVNLESADGFRVVGDERVAPGGCRILTDRGEVDARLETQLVNIRKQFLGKMETDA